MAYESSGISLGTFKSLNESLTRVAVYISLMTLYWLGGDKVKAVISKFFLIISKCFNV